MKKFINVLIVTSLTLFTACTPAPAQPTAFQPHITQRLARTETPNRPPLSDIDKSGKLLYFLVQSGDKVELKKRDLITKKEDLVRIFPYGHEILKFALAADEFHIAFMSKENDQFLVYITDLGGERLIKVAETTAKSDYGSFTPESFVLKRVGLKHKFLFIERTHLDCGAEILSYVSRNTVLTCKKNTEIIPDEQLLIVETEPGGKSMLATTDYENWEPQKILELPLDETAIEDIELLDDKTLRVTTSKEYLDVRFKE